MWPTLCQLSVPSTDTKQHVLHRIHCGKRWPLATATSNSQKQQFYGPVCRVAGVSVANCSFWCLVWPQCNFNGSFPLAEIWTVLLAVSSRILFSSSTVNEFCSNLNQTLSIAVDNKPWLTQYVRYSSSTRSTIIMNISSKRSGTMFDLFNITCPALNSG